MTTKVTVDTHAGWPVSVLQRELKPDGSIERVTEVVVPPNETREFHVHTHMQILVAENPRSR